MSDIRPGPHQQRPDETGVTVRSMYGYRTRRALVLLSIGDKKPLQFSPHEARTIAQLLMESAEAAEQDAFIMEFARDDLGLDEERAAQLMGAFRARRLDWEEREDAH